MSISFVIADWKTASADFCSTPPEGLSGKSCRRRVHDYPPNQTGTIGKGALSAKIGMKVSAKAQRRQL
jgi:hypothetical protein